MNKLFTPNGWQDYVYWQTEDKKTLKKINKLIDDISRNGNEGIGKPEPLIGNFKGFWSRRINDKDRLIYKIDEGAIYIISCRQHYTDHSTEYIKIDRCILLFRNTNSICTSQRQV